MAKFCAEMDIKYHQLDYKEMLYKGHRGYVSYSEDDLAKEFDKKLQILRDKYSVLKAHDDERMRDKWYRQSDEYVEVTLWYEEGVEIANEVFEEMMFT